MGCTEAGVSLCGPDLLDYTVNDRPLRRAGQPNSNRSHAPAMAPHNIYAARGTDEWIAIACRDDDDWARLAALIDEPWARDEKYATLAGRLDDQDALDAHMTAGRATRDRHTHRASRSAPPACRRRWSRRPEDRVDHDPGTSEFGLWPVAHHTEMGDVRVDGIPVHMSETDWSIERGAPVSRRAHRRRVARRARPRRRRDRVAPRGGGGMSAPRSDRHRAARRHQGRRDRERARRVGGQAPRRSRRRRGRRRTTGRPCRAAATGRSSTTSPDPSAACSGGTTTRRSAASCSTSADADDAARFRDLVGDADIVLEGEPIGTLADARPRPRLRCAPIMLSSSGSRSRPFGRTTSRAHEPATDLTLLAGGGPVWNCGYDDHTHPARTRRREPGVPHRAACSRR